VDFLLRLLFRPMGMMLAGLAAASFGLFMSFGEPSPIPAKADLKQIAGVLDSASKITKRRRFGSTVSYELAIKDSSGTVAKLTLPEREIGEEQVKSLFGGPVRVLYAGDKDVWEIAVGDKPVVAYDATKANRIKSQAEMVADGPYLAATGGLVFIIGLLWKLWRQRAKLA